MAIESGETAWILDSLGSPSQFHLTSGCWITEIWPEIWENYRGCLYLIDSWPVVLILHMHWMIWFHSCFLGWVLISIQLLELSQLPLQQIFNRLKRWLHQVFQYSKVLAIWCDYIYIYTYTHTHTHTYICMYAYINISLYIYIYTYAVWTPLGKACLTNWLASP